VNRMQGVLRYDEFGSLNDIVFVLNLLDPSDKRHQNEIVEYCSNDLGFSRIPAQSTMALLKTLGFVWMDSKDICLTESGLKLQSMDSIESIRKGMIIEVMNWVRNDSQFQMLFESLSINYDYIKDRYVVNNSSIPLSFSAFKRLLIDLGVLTFLPPPFNRELVVSKEFLRIFEEVIGEKRRELSLTQFRQLQKRMEEQGEAAEEFVLRFEKNRLLEHQQSSRIKRISKLDVGAGYDIISFESKDSKEIDRFIEVKSFSQEPSFHWSSNEIRVAERKGSKYYIYIVESSRIADSTYEPWIIKEPLLAINQTNNWKVTNDGLFAELIKKY